MRQAMAVVNGKGGTLKTSLTANVAGLVAASDYRVLTIDLDPQGNLALDLGYDGDGGASLAGAAGMGLAPQVVADVRPRLDVIAGGRLLSNVRLPEGDEEAVLRLRHALDPVVAEGGYDLVLIDCPPGEEMLQRAAMAAVSWLVIPVALDRASREGLRRVARLYAQSRAGANPELAVLGGVLVNVDPAATRIREQARAAVAEDLGDVPVFEQTIRHATGPAVHGRGRGLLAHEVEGHAASLPRFWEEGYDPQQSVGRQSSAHLAEDYQRLAEEILGTYARQAVA
jgi:cellulose biosynthesis protein BcsQ